MVSVATVLTELFSDIGIVNSSNNTWDGYVLQQFADGRFVLTKDLMNIVDTVDPKIHMSDADTPLMFRAFKDIAGLTDTETLSVLYLYALAVKPLKLPEDILRSNALKVFYLGRRFETGFVEPSDVVWLYPDGGIQTTKLGYKYIPMCSRYGVNTDGSVWDLKEDREVPYDKNDLQGIALETDMGQTIRLPILDILTLAFGKYDQTNYNKPAFSTVNVDHADYGKLSTTYKTLSEEIATAVTLTSLGERIKD